MVQPLTTTQVVETAVTVNNSPTLTRTNDHTQPTYEI